MDKGKGGKRKEKGKGRKKGLGKVREARKTDEWEKKRK